MNGSVALEMRNEISRREFPRGSDRLGHFDFGHMTRAKDDLRQAVLRSVFTLYAIRWSKHRELVYVLISRCAEALLVRKIGRGNRLDDLNYPGHWHEGILSSILVQSTSGFLLA